jgi:hypothetical protein
VGVLYIPLGRKYFGCRLCYNLTYRSCQEQHKDERWFRDIALSLQAEHPGITPAEIRYVWDKSGSYKDRKSTPRGGYFDRALKAQLHGSPADQTNFPDPRAHYLTAGDLGKQSGLTPEALARLETARLLLPDTKDGRYRPKLAGWGRKLAYLISQGWSIDEIQRWAKGRWLNPDPRKWPPDSDDWRS